MEELKKFLVGFLGSKCYVSLVEEMDIFGGGDFGCAKLLVSKLLSVLILGGSLIVKVPQIMTIYSNWSIAQLSFSMFFLEVLGYGITASYGFRSKFDVTAYGENVFMLLQSSVIILLFLRIQKPFDLIGAVAFVALFAFIYVLVSGFVPFEYLQHLQIATIGIFALSRIPQIISNFRAQRTGKLSGFMVTLNFFGALARMFTTFQQLGGDILMLSSAASGALLNFILVFQVLYYGESGRISSTATVEKRKH